MGCSLLLPHQAEEGGTSWERAKGACEHCRTIPKTRERTAILERVHIAVPGDDRTGAIPACWTPAQGGHPQKEKAGVSQSPGETPEWPLETFDRWLSNSWACCAGMKWPGQAGAGGRPEGHQPQSRGSPPGALIGTKGRPCFPVGVLSHQLSREAGQSPASPHVHRRHPQ